MGCVPIPNMRTLRTLRDGQGAGGGRSHWWLHCDEPVRSGVLPTACGPVSAGIAGQRFSAFDRRIGTLLGQARMGNGGGTHRRCPTASKLGTRFTRTGSKVWMRSSSGPPASRSLSLLTKNAGMPPTGPGVCAQLPSARVAPATVQPRGRRGIPSAARATGTTGTGRPGGIGRLGGPHRRGQQAEAAPDQAAALPGGPLNSGAASAPTATGCAAHRARRSGCCRH